MERISWQKLEEWLQLAEIIAQQAAAASSKPSTKPKSSETKFTEFKVSLDNNTLKLGDLSIPLFSRPKTMQLIRPFFAKSDQFLSKDEMLKAVYSLDRNVSQRLRQSHNQNLLKLISRSRKYLETACSRYPFNKTIEWFPFDKKTNCYRLYQLISPGTAR